MPAARGLRVAVVGATGLVGRELLSLLEKRRFPVDELLLFNSGRSAFPAGFRDRALCPRPPSLGALKAADLIFMVSSDGVSRRFGPSLARAGRWVIDDSSAFRLDPRVPLILPEVNAAALSSTKKLVSGPNCTLTGAAVAGYPLLKAAGAKAVRIASYQSVSGAGTSALKEFRAQLAAEASGGKIPPPKVLPRPLAMNLFPHVGAFDAAGNSSEETRVAAELRKIWAAPGLAVSVTAVRVPVVRGHSLAVWLETRKPISTREARKILARAPGIRLWPHGDYPTPRDVAGTWPVHVARLRRGAGKNELCFWVASDNLLKGAALNSVQIAEELLRRGWL